MENHLAAGALPAKANYIGKGHGQHYHKACRPKLKFCKDYNCQRWTGADRGNSMVTITTPIP